MEVKTTIIVYNRHIGSIINGFLATVVALALLCGCTPSSDAVSQSDKSITVQNTQLDYENWYFTDNDIVEWHGSTSKEFMNEKNFQYEREAARRYYQRDNYKELKDTPRNEMLDAYGLCAFDSKGNGVFVIEDPEGLGMHHHMYYIEYTTDYGKTWNVSNKYFYFSYYIYELRVIGNRVLMIAGSDVQSKSFILYSDDMCKTFRRCDIAAHLPEYKKNLFYRTENMQILDVNQKDGSIILGFYDEKETYYPSFGEYNNIGSEKKQFLIVRANREFKSFEVIYADDEYIEKTVYNYYD